MRFGGGDIAMALECFERPGCCCRRHHHHDDHFYNSRRLGVLYRPDDDVKC